jgi:hypothetical protein
MTDERGAEQSQTPGARTLEIVIRVVHDKGQINAECVPTLHNFLIDELPRAGYHAMRALANAINDAVERGPTD